MFTISFFSPIAMNDIRSEIKAIAQRKAQGRKVRAKRKRRKKNG